MCIFLVRLNSTQLPITTPLEEGVAKITLSADSSRLPINTGTPGDGSA